MEYTPFVLILIGRAETSGAPSGLLWVVGLGFASGYLVHAVAMLTNPYPPALRAISMLKTYAAMIIPATYFALLVL